MFWRKKKARKKLLRLIEIGAETANKVNELPKRRRLEIYALLCAGEWVADLGTKPDNWDAMSQGDRDLILDDSIRCIIDEISLKERSRYLRMTLQGETQEEFNDWWESRFLEALLKIASRI